MMTGYGPQNTKNTVTLKNKDMEAWLYLVPPEGGKDYEFADILNILNKAGVRDGINDSRVTAMIKKKIYGREVLIAEGRSPVDGVDGYYEFACDINRKKKPEIREDGSVDYTSVNVIDCVNAGDIVAMYHPAVKGRAGSNVKAKIIQPRPAREKPQLSCRNVTFDPESMIYRAAADGRIDYSRTKISVESLQVFTQTIDNVFGNVNFKGDVVIHGSVMPGVKISAEKSVTIDGTLESSDIEAGTDVIIKGGVVGNETSHIDAGGNVMADFIQFSEINAGGSVSANIILGSRVEAVGEVHATGKLGAIVGGNVYGMAGVDCIFSGNDVMLRTVVAAGIRNSIVQQKLSIERREKFIEEKLTEIEKNADELERSIRLGNTDDIMLKKRQELMRDKIERSTALNAVKWQLSQITDKIEGSHGAHIQVKDTCFNGTVVQIDDQQIVINSDRRQVEFFKDKEDTLVIHPVINW